MLHIQKILGLLSSIIYNFPHKSLLVYVTKREKKIILKLYLTVHVHCILYHSKLRHSREKEFFSYSGDLLCQDSTENPHVVVHHKLQ